ncbi:MAG: hypothetical protein LBC09_01825, partial [Helicobacteraceae bacterium]|nr:hypothetical protein [Helicobacteraceae bacterium]
EASVESGGTLSYQWYKNTRNNTTDATAITGATGAAYKPSTADIGTLYYFVKVTNTNNSVGGEQTATVTSKRAQVIVNAPSSANTHIVNVTTRI